MLESGHQEVGKDLWSYQDYLRIAGTEDKRRR